LIVLASSNVPISVYCSVVPTGPRCNGGRSVRSTSALATNVASSPVSCELTPDGWLAAIIAVPTDRATTRLRSPPWLVVSATSGDKDVQVTTCVTLIVLPSG
jgi:hypothetical protein